MATITDSVLNQKTLYAGSSPTPNLKYGGQSGYLPRIGMVGPDGKNYDEWISNQAYVSRNIIPVVIRAPKFFSLLPEPARWLEVYKALLEVHALSIVGLTSEIELTTDEHAIGGGGEFQEEVTDSKRTRSAISYTFKEKTNKAIVKFLDYYIRYGIMDPDVKKPLISTSVDTSSIPSAELSTGTILFIETDISQRVVVDAWLCSNFFPRRTGERTGQRNLTSAGETKDLSIDFASITMNNEAVLNMATNILNGLTILNNIPDINNVVPSSEITPEVAASAVGFNEARQ